MIKSDELVNDPAVAAVQYVLSHPTDEPIIFLKLWNEGEFETIRKEWPDVPAQVFIGADPLYQIFSRSVFIWAWPDGDWEFEGSEFPNLLNCKSDDCVKLCVPDVADYDDIGVFVSKWSDRLHSNKPLDISKYWIEQMGKSKRLP